MVKFLLENESPVNFKDLVGRTALNFAVEAKNLAIVKALLCFKADPTLKNNKK